MLISNGDDVNDPAEPVPVSGPVVPAAPTKFCAVGVIKNEEDVDMDRPRLPAPPPPPRGGAGVSNPSEGGTDMMI